MSALLKESIDSYHGAGYRLVELHPIRGGNCSCGQDDCRLTGKHPAKKGWQQNEQAYNLLVAYCEHGMDISGFGVLLSDSDLIVDVDPKNGGLESFNQLVEMIPELNECNFGVKSGGGGFHLYYKKDPSIRTHKTVKKLPGIEFLSKGCFVVGAGSLHKSANYYTPDYGYTTDIKEVDPAPEYLVSLLKIDTTSIPKDKECYSEYTRAEINNILNYIPNVDIPYEDWLKIGMGLHHASESYFDLWDDWSKNYQLGGKEYAGNTEYNLKKWESFNSSGEVTIGTVIALAVKNGYEHTEQALDLTEYFKEREEEKTDLDISTDHIDIYDPPGLVGDIVKYINRTAFKQRPKLSLAAALYVASCSLNKLYLTPSGGKLSLYAMGIAASGSGKDHPYAISKEILIKLGYAQAIFPEMASNVDMYKSIIKNQIAFYIMDEAHKIFAHLENERSQTYIQNISSAMLQLKTEKTFIVRDKEAKELSEEINKKLDLYKKLGEKGDEEKEQFYKNRANWEEKKKSYINQGLINPIVNIYATSTPIELDKSITYRSIANGLIGRFFIFREDENFPRPMSYGISSHQKESIPESIIYKLGMIIAKGRSKDTEFIYNPAYGLEYWGEATEMQATEEAKAISEKVDLYFVKKGEEAPEELQPIYARAFEHVLLIASLIACETAVITYDHLMYAFAFVKSDITTKILMIAKAKKKKDDSLEDRIQSAKVDILDVCRKKNGETPSVILRKIKKYKLSDEQIDEIIDSLIDCKSLECITKKWNGRESRKFITRNVI